MYIGNKEIKTVETLENGVSKVTMAEGEPFEISTELLGKIQTDTEGQGSITDNINNYFARKFLAELAYYGLDYYFAKHIGISLEVLAHNSREQKIAELFGATSSDSIKLSQLFKEDENTNSVAS